MTEGEKEYNNSHRLQFVLSFQLSFPLFFSHDCPTDATQMYALLDGERRLARLLPRCRS